MIQEQIFRHSSHKLIYKFRGSQQDRRHLLVVFSSGFGGTYDFQGNFAKSIRSSILWIKDPLNTYYIRDGVDFSMELAVVALIENFRLDLGLDKRNCTFLGSSKGATGALYHAIKYDYPNVVAAVPRMNIGSANRRERPDILAGLVQEGTESEIESLDNLLLEQLLGDSNLNRNVYLITSSADVQYETEIVPFLNLYSRYDNFNYVVTRSPLVREHSEVTRYNIPMIGSIVSALGEGAVPKYGWVHNGAVNHRSSLPLPSLQQVQKREELVSHLSRMEIMEGRLHCAGVAFIRGFPAKRYGDVNTRFVLSGKDYRDSIPMGGVIDHVPSQSYYENSFCDYSVSSFADRGGAGIDLVPLDYGIYSIGLDVRHADIRKTSSRISGIVRQRPTVHKDSVYFIRSMNDSFEIVKRPIVSGIQTHCYFEIVDYSFQQEKLHVEGYFAVQGVQAKDWGSFSYYLVVSDECGVVVHSQALAQAARSGVSELIGDPWIDYSKSYFATPGYAGIELPPLADGNYLLSVSLVADSDVYTRSLNLTMIIQDTAEGTNRSLLPSVPA